MTPSHPAAPRRQCSASSARPPPQRQRRIVTPSRLLSSRSVSLSLLREALDALGRRIERRRRPPPGSPGALGGLRRGRPAATASSGSNRCSFVLGLRQLVGQGERRHHGQPRVADLAEPRAQLLRCAGRDPRPAPSDGPPRPSSQAMRNWRPLMVTFTCVMAFPTRRRSCSSLARRAPSGWCRWRHRAARATSRLVVSSSRARAAARSRSDASRERSAATACSWAVSPSAPRSASRRRSTAASSASSASARRLVAASIALGSVIARIPPVPPLPPGFVSLVAAKIFRIGKRLEQEALRWIAASRQRSTAFRPAACAWRAEPRARLL